MKKNKKIPDLKSYEEMAEFWDTHDMTDFWDETEPAQFDISSSVNPVKSMISVIE